MTKKQPESPALRVREYFGEGDEGYFVRIATLTWHAPAKGRPVSDATWYHASLAKLLIERYGVTQKRAIATVTRTPQAYGRVKRALEKLNAGGGHPQNVPEPIIEKAAKLL